MVYRESGTVAGAGVYRSVDGGEVEDDAGPGEF